MGTAIYVGMHDYHSCAVIVYDFLYVVNIVIEDIYPVAGASARMLKISKCCLRLLRQPRGSGRVLMDQGSEARVPGERPKVSLEAGPA